ncbi:MAG: PAS domain S-box protein [Inquilinus sp.]|nr:PAS domain S-box protein [Inquilinus sp.]
MIFDWFILPGDAAVEPVEYSYAYGYVVLSYLVAALSSFTAFHLLQRVIAASTRSATMVWLAAGAASMGCGTWSMHFLGMLAVQMPHVMRYDAFLTGLSVVLAIAASAVAFQFAREATTRVSRLVVAGTLLGLGIGAMHYTGMAAMRMDSLVRYHPSLFLASIGVAVALSTLALRLMLYGVHTTGGSRRLRQVGTAAIMGLAITLMHYTGMAATEFIPAVDHAPVEGIAINGQLMSFAIIVGCLTVFAAVSLAALVDRRMKAAGDALQNSGRVLRAIIDTASDGIVTIDAIGNVRTMNAGAERIFGYRAEEIVGRSIVPLISAFGGGDGSFDASGYLHDETDKIDVSHQATGHCKDGGTALLEFAVSKMNIGGQAMFTAIIRDVTKRQMAHDELARSAAKLRANQQHLTAIMNSVVEAVISIDEAGIIQSFNSAAERTFGYSVSEAVGQNVGILMPDPHREKHDGYIERFIDTGEATVIGKHREFVGRRRDGSEFPIEITVNWMDVGGSVMFVGVCRDITLRKQADAERASLEKELQQAQRMESLGTLAGGVAHEINTPVQYVSDNTRFLQTALADLGTVLQKYDRLAKESLTGETLAAAIADAKSSAEAADLDFLIEEIPTAIEQSLEGIDRISEIVRAIKEFSHPQSKDKTPTDINHAIATTITVSRNQWKYSAELKTDFDSSLTDVPCLPGEFNQVILNLIINAAHAIEDTGKQGRIVVTTRRHDSWAEIGVSDTGAGVAPENLRKVFDPFFTTKDPGKGTGQGLAISHNIIVTKHGGSIAIKSQPGEGTTVTIRLPLGDADKETAVA